MLHSIRTRSGVPTTPCATYTRWLRWDAVPACSRTDSDLRRGETCTHVAPTASAVSTATPDASASGKDKFPGLCTPDESYHGLTYTKKFGKMAYMTKLVAQLMRDLGSIPSPHNSFLLNLGLETLHLRVPQHCKNAQRIAEFLAADERVAWVHYSGLPSDKNYALAQKYLPNGSCGVIAFGLKGDRQTAVEFMDSLQMIAIVTHVADARTCVLHPASHTHRQLSDEQLREAGVPGLSLRFFCLPVKRTQFFHGLATI